MMDDYQPISKAHVIKEWDDGSRMLHPNSAEVREFMESLGFKDLGHCWVHDRLERKDMAWRKDQFVSYTHADFWYTVVQKLKDKK